MKKHFFYSITLILVLLLLVVGCSANSNSNEGFEWGATKSEIRITCENETFFGEDIIANCISYKQTNVDYFQNDEVVVIYYFNGTENGLSKVIYDVSNCDTKNVDAYIEHLRKDCTEIKYGESKIGNTTYFEGEWEFNNTSISYEKLSDSWVKFYFKPIE